jgi:hypothetical protein
MNDDKIINKISQIRKNNNKLWMNILKIAFKKDEKKARKILRDIVVNDSKITELCKILCNKESK